MERKRMLCEDLGRYFLRSVCNQPSLQSCDIRCTQMDMCCMKVSLAGPKIWDLVRPTTYSRKTGHTQSIQEDLSLSYFLYFYLVGNTAF